MELLGDSQVLAAKPGKHDSDDADALLIRTDDVVVVFFIDANANYLHMILLQLLDKGVLLLLVHALNSDRVHSYDYVAGLSRVSDAKGRQLALYGTLGLIYGHLRTKVSRLMTTPKHNRVLSSDDRPSLVQSDAQSILGRGPLRLRYLPHLRCL